MGFMGSSFSLSLPLPLPPSPQAQSCWWVPPSHNDVGPAQHFHLITTAAAAASLRLHFLLQSCFQNFSRIHHVPRLKDEWVKQVSHLKGINLFQFEDDYFVSKFSPTKGFFNGGQPTKGFGSAGKLDSAKSRKRSYNGRLWTNILIGINILVYAGQVATEGKLLHWGAKVNSLIHQGQFWRLVTSAFLHANAGHLMVNCFSLNSVGPTIEKLSGPKRFLAVYFASAIAGSAMSYGLCKAPSVGASGAIFGLVGSLAVFVIRHQGMIGGGKQELQHIARVILLNLMVGTAFRGIDNWGHLGGFLGGAAVSWLVGPAWKYEAISYNGRRIIVDEAPIRLLTNRRKRS
ncbi:hypothetical protein Tsubulata_033626 [Turnera subulata]|uniref:Peptidase S54 rhomboid domain-containing protein n=1 Tax=Turnera subulata TaxID=218843 RepID=A0A9Q0J0Q7_9ROSI|nr:hypothetical protein Tsubulata_033626 [Turnera subulata]